MKKQTMSIKIMAEIAIFAALGFILDLIQGAYSDALFANGGGIGIAMIVVFLMCYRRGPVAGFLTGLIMGVLQMMGGFYTCSNVWWKNLLQIGFDYVIAYALCFVAGYFRPLYFRATTKTKKGVWLAVGTFIGGLMKYFSHFMSGVLFWPENPTDKAWARITYSLTYNGGYMIPSIILCTVLFTLIILSQPQFVLDSHLDNEQYESSKHPLAKLISLISTGACGLGLFVTFLVLSIKESSFESWGSSGGEYSEAHFGRASTYMICLVIGLVLVFVALYYLFGYLKNRSQSLKVYFVGAYTMSLGAILGSLTYLFKFSYKVFTKLKNPIEKGYDNPAYYGIWLLFGIVLLVSTIICNFKFKEEI